MSIRRSRNRFAPVKNNNDLITRAELNARLRTGNTFTTSLNGKSYVSKTGNNNTYKPYNFGKPAIEPVYAANNQFTSGDLIHVLPGTYAWGTGLDVEPSVDYKDDQLGNSGQIARYYFDNGVKLTANNEFVNPWGLGDAGFPIAAGSELYIDGSAEFEYNTSNPLDGAIFIEGANDTKFYLNAKSVKTTGGDAWGLRVVEHERCFIDLDEVDVEGLGIAIGPGKVVDSYTEVNVGLMTMRAASTRSGLLRYQPGTDGAADTNKATTVFNINKMIIESGAEGIGYYQQANTGGNEHDVVVNIGSISDYSDPGATVTQYTADSGAAGSAAANIQLAGGQSTEWVNSNFTCNVNQIQGISPVVNVQGQHFDNCSIVINVPYGYSSKYYAVGFFNPLIHMGADMIISGFYESDSTSHACLMMNQLDLNGTGTLIFQDATFKAGGAGMAAVAISSNVANEIDRIIFQRCKFLNDGTVAPIITNAGATVNVKMIDCYANSTVALGDIADPLGGLTVNTTII